MGRNKSKAWSYYKYKYSKYTYVKSDESVRKGINLYDDVENFLFNHDRGIDSLVTMLLSGQIHHRRYTDPEHLF
jgi:hypothetical protein